MSEDDHLSAARDAVESARQAVDGDTQTHLDTVLDELEVLDEDAESDRAEGSPEFEEFDAGDQEHVQELEETLSDLQKEEALDAEAREHINEGATALRRYRQSQK